jgi:hypothetical protein
MIIKGDNSSFNDKPSIEELKSLVNEHKLQRSLDLKKNTRIYNSSGKNASLIVSKKPILDFSSLAIDNSGKITFNSSNEYNYQEFIVANLNYCSINIDSSAIYYTVFFYFDNEQKWKFCCKNMKHDTYINTSTSSNIFLMDRQADTSVDI